MKSIAYESSGVDRGAARMVDRSAKASVILRTLSEPFDSAQGKLRESKGTKNLIPCLLSFVFIFSLSLVACPLSLVHANNAAVSNVYLVDPDASTDTVKIQFNVSWSNGWRNSTNRDAVWVFAKYTTQNSAPYTWNHCILKTSGTNPTGFSQGIGTGLDVVVPSDKRGAMLELSSASTTSATSISTAGVKLVWDYGASGLSDTASVTVRVFAVEMVYIPAGAFYLGDGNGSTEAVQALHVTNNTSFQISTADVSAVTSDSNSDDDIDTASITLNGASGLTGNGGSPVNPQWPVGYNAFYLMKYEITQGQFTDFLNTLTRAQQNNRVRYGGTAGGAAGGSGGPDISGDTVTNVYVMANASSVTNRHVISCPASGNGTTNPITFSVATNKDDRACNYLSWQDVAAFLDWAALRPMTETEFEKACRGTTANVVGEYAWGSTGITAATTISGTENGAETITNKNANANYNSTTFTGGDAGSGPVRAGIFAAAFSASRPYNGAGYYGNMELSGNVWDRCVTLGNSTGRAFVGSHGDGALTTTSSYEGNATNTDWPGIDGTVARGVTGATGSGFRGGGWGSSSAYIQVSDRSNAAATLATRTNAYGGRGARTMN